MIDSSSSRPRHFPHAAVHSLTSTHQSRNLLYTVLVILGLDDGLLIKAVAAVLPLEDGEGALDGVEDDVLDLQLVLGELLRGGHGPHGLHQVEHHRQRLGRGKVHVHGDARLEVLHLEEKWGSC